MEPWSACKPCESVTASVIVSKGARADDGLHAIRGCDETTISNRRRRRARRSGADQHRGLGSTPIPLRLSLFHSAYLTLPIRRAGWGRDTNPDRDADTTSHTSNGHNPGAGLSAEHGAR